MWIKLLEDDDHVITARKVVAYRKGQIVNVPHSYGEEAIARGVAEASSDPDRMPVSETADEQNEAAVESDEAVGEGS